jgi:hypothetical protein
MVPEFDWSYNGHSAAEGDHYADCDSFATDTWMEPEYLKF